MSHKEASPLAGSDRLLSALDISLDMNCSRGSVYRWMHDGLFETVQIAGTLRARESSYRAWRDAGASKSAPDIPPSPAEAGKTRTTSSLAAESGALPLMHETPLTFWLMGCK